MPKLWLLLALALHAMALCSVFSQDTSSESPFAIVRSVDDVLHQVAASTRTTAVLVISTAQMKQLEQPASDDDITALVTAMAPHFSSVVQGLRDAVDVIVADVADAKPAVTKWHVTALPALITYADVPKQNPYTGEMYRDAVVEDISVLTQPSKLRKRLRDRIPSTHVTDLASLSSEKDMEDFIAQHSTKKDQDQAKDQNKVVMLVSRQKTPSHLFRAVAVALNGRQLTFAYVPSSAKIADAVMRKISNEEEEHSGALLVIWSSVDEFQVVEAKDIATYAALEAAVLPFAGERRAEEGENNNSKEKKTWSSSEPRKIPRGRAVTMLTAESFRSDVMESDLVWIVAFLTAEQSEERSEAEWNRRLRELQQGAGIIALGGVHCATEEQLCQKYGGPGLVRVFPIKATQTFTPKISRDAMLDEEFETIEEATQAAIDSLPNRVHVLHEYPELSAFIADTIRGKAMPVLMMTKNPSIPPMLKGLALSLRQNVAFGLVWNPDDGIKQKFNVRASASKAFVCLIEVDKPDTNAPADHAPFGVIMYKKKTMGPYSYPNLLRFLVSVLTEYPRPPVDDDDSSSFDDSDRFSDATADGDVRAHAAAVTVPYLTKQNAAELCGGNSICAIAFLQEHPDELEDPSSALPSRLEVLQHVAAQSHKDRQPYRFMWTNGKCQRAFAEAFEVGAFQMPTTVVYAPSKQRYATNMGLFDEENTAAFLRGVLSGSISTVPVPDKVPELVDACSLADVHEEDVAAVDDADDEDLGDLLSEIREAEEKQRRELEDAVRHEQKRMKKTTNGKRKQKQKQTKAKKAKRSKKTKRDEL